MGSWWTRDHTLIRKSTVLVGDNNGLDLFNPSLEWDSLPPNSFPNLGTHTCSCTNSSNLEERNLSYLLYPNPVQNNAKLIIQSPQQIKEVVITDLFAKTILVSDRDIIDTSSFARGIYLVSVEFINF